MVSGKTLLARIDDRTPQTFGTAIGAFAIARAHRANEIHAEVEGVISAIEEGIVFHAHDTRFTKNRSE
jgi:hypothetical protein